MPQGASQFDLPEQFVTRPEELSACCEHIASSKRFGLDTEFVGEETYHPDLCLIQIATTERLIVIDPLAVGPLDQFWSLVTDPANEVVVHAGREEVRLCRLSTGRAPANLFDLQIAAGLVGLSYPMGHGALVHQLLHVRLSKAETRTEWRNRPLTPEQLSYAFDDVRYLLPLWKKISARLTKLARSDWAREEFARQIMFASPEEAPVERWRKLRGLGSLDRRRLALVKALHEWREETAARTNRPARSLCRDDLIIEIARRNPTREQDLRVIRGLPRRDVGAILQTVATARSIPLEQCPTVDEREQDPPQIQWVTNVLTAMLGDYCARSSLAANLVASTSDVKALVRSKLNGGTFPADCPLTTGWRAVHVLPRLLAILEGRTSVRIGDLASDSPFMLSDEQPAST